MALLPLRRRGARHPAIRWAAFAVIAVVGLDFAAGLTRDTVELSDRTTGGIARATLAACGTRTPLHPVMFSHSTWHATPPRLCGQPTTLTLTTRDGTISTCTGFRVTSGHDYRVIVTDRGCGGYNQTVLPAVP